MKLAQTVLDLRNISKKYEGNQSFALSEIDFSVTAGTIVALLGESGSGKTTLLRLIAGFERPNSGIIQLAAKVVADASHIVPPEKRGIGMVFQDYALFPHFTVYENIAYGLQGMPKSAQRLRIQEVLSLVDLLSLEKRYPHELSGGQQQRVALARALAPKPHLLLLDEPFSNLDEGLKAQVRRDLKKILKESATTTIFVTHDTQDALSGADEIVLLQNGNIQQIDSPQALYNQPANLYVASYFGTVNWLKATISDGFAHTALGKMPVSRQISGNCQIGIRPHCIVPSTPDSAASSFLFEGKVTRQEFLGTHQEVLIDVGHDLVLEARLPSNHPSIINTSISWAFHSHEVFYLP